MSVPSSSLAKAVMPTAEPVAAFSEMVFVVASVSLMAETPLSFTSVTSMVKLCVAVDPSDEVAVTSIVWSWFVS